MQMQMQATWQDGVLTDVQGMPISTNRTVGWLQTHSHAVAIPGLGTGNEVA